jgi:lipopolysaccharide export system protein LptA
MPGPWLAFGALLPGLFSGSYPQLPAIQTLDEEVVVIAKSQRRDMAKGTIEFSDGVTVLYGPTKITANRVIYTDRPGERSAIAEGKVALDDPEGSLSAEKVVILWLPTGRTATAENI